MMMNIDILGFTYLFIFKGQWCSKLVIVLLLFVFEFEVVDDDENKVLIQVLVHPTLIWHAI
jgi:hypothetical protein